MITKQEAVLALTGEHSKLRGQLCVAIDAAIKNYIGQPIKVSTQGIPDAVVSFVTELYQDNGWVVRPTTIVEFDYRETWCVPAIEWCVPAIELS